jgi:A/G-specific adenine glycosylase
LVNLAGDPGRAKLPDGTGPAIPEPRAEDLLQWYDRERRHLPWRYAPGDSPDPYRVWLSEIMLQQTRVETVARYYERFLARFPTVETLAAARLDSVLKLWAGLGYYARARNLYACACEIVLRYNGRFPDTEEELRELPGIGAYTAAAIASIAFGRKATPVDGNVERVVARLYSVETPLPAAKPVLRRLAEGLVPATRAGDFAQAMMDLGATICTPKGPSCGSCPWRSPCVARLRGVQEVLPRRVPKTEGELRRGAAFVVLREDGAVLVRRRPREGLLGGMTEVPGTEWSPNFDLANAQRAAGQLLPFVPAIAWRRLPGSVHHVFTHFPLELTVFLAAVSEVAEPPRGMRFVKRERIGGEALPALMRKVVAHAVPEAAPATKNS